MKKNKYNTLLFWLLTVVFISVSAWAIYWFVFKQDTAQNALGTTTKVVRGDVENVVTATGILQPKDYVDVGAQVSGQLKVLHFDIGEW